MVILSRDLSQDEDRIAGKIEPNHIQTCCRRFLLFIRMFHAKGYNKDVDNEQQQKKEKKSKVK